MRLLLTLLAAAALAAAVCTGHAGAQEKPPAKPAGLSDLEKAVVEKFLEIKLEEARESVENRNYDYAVKIIDAILLLAPKTRLSKELQDLRLTALEKKLQQRTVRVYLYCSGKIHKAGEEMELMLRIKNLSNGKIELPVGSAQKRNFGILTKKTTDFKLFGSTHERQVQTTLKQDSSIILEKGRVWETSFKFKTPQPGGSEPAIRRYIFQASLRPVEIITAEEHFSRYLRTGELELWVVPSGHEKFTEKALANLTEAAAFLRGKPAPGELAVDSETEARIAMFYSTFFLTESEKKKATPLLAGLLEKADNETARVIMGSLTFVTGEEFGTSKQDWLDWWKIQKDK